MAENNKHQKPRTHNAFTMKREGRRLRQGRWLQIGSARQDDSGIMHLFLDTLPIGGFSGYVYLSPIGAEPPVLEAPQRPGANEDEDEAAEADD
jgi:hypothetical protein